MSDQEIVEKCAQVWTSIAELCTPFVEQQWKTMTECPGWSVQDHLAHLIGTESGLLGRPLPQHTPAEAPYVKNDIGKRNEIWVDSRRTWPGTKVLEEFKEVTAERLRVLRGMGDADFSQQTQTPIGPGTVRDFMNIRIFDGWVHEQDIRRAVGKPGHLTGAVAEHALGRIVMALPFVVGKKAQAVDGTTVVFDIHGALARTVVIGVEGSRARPLSTPPATPTVRLTLDIETLNCLGCGRWEPGRVLASGKVRIDGDQTLGETIVRQMNFMI